MSNSIFFLGGVGLAPNGQCCWAQKQDSHQPNTDGEVQFLDDSDVWRSIAGCSAVLGVFWGTAIPANALKMQEVRDFPLVFFSFLDRCGIFPAQSFPLRKIPRTPPPPPPGGVCGCLLVIAEGWRAEGVGGGAGGAKGATCIGEPWQKPAQTTGLSPAYWKKQ